MPSHILVAVATASLPFNFKYLSPPPKLALHTHQLVEEFKFLTITISGAEDSPCPTVAAAKVPVYLTILNPASEKACTVLVILPLELLLVVPPFAFQHHAT